MKKEAVRGSGKRHHRAQAAFVLSVMVNPARHCSLKFTVRGLTLYFVCFLAVAIIATIELIKLDLTTKQVLLPAKLIHQVQSNLHASVGGGLFVIFVGAHDHG